MTSRKTWKILSQAPESFKTKFPQYSQIILNLIYHRLPHNLVNIENFFNPDYTKTLHSPFLFKDMSKAVKRILEAVDKKEKIAIFGDYDVDGVTSVLILCDTLSALGSEPTVYIPDRKDEGYGLNFPAITEFKKKKIKLLITVDCGVRDIEEIEKANKLGLDVIITDHHLPGRELPKALAIINPRLKNERYPFKDLAGVGVAYKLALALIKEVPEQFPAGFEKWLLDLVALGTVADMVPLLGENRTLVKYGLVVLNKTRRLGLQELFKTARLNFSSKNPLGTSQIGFQIAPRINSAGRIDHANFAFALLNTQEKAEAQKIASNLEEKNSQRQKITHEIVQKIEEKVDKNQKLIFVGQKGWPIGILGLVAGKICEKFARPTFVYTIKDQLCRGSIRSLGKFKVVATLEECRDLLIDYGGHDFAGGFSFNIQNEKKLAKKLQKIADKLLSEKDLVQEIQIDGRISLTEVNQKMYKDLKKLEPFGSGNPAPLFLAEKVKVFGCNIIGSDNKHLKIWFQDGEQYFEAIAFGKGNRHGSLVTNKNTFLDIIFEISSDEWNGEKKLTLIIRDFRISP